MRTIEAENESAERIKIARLHKKHESLKQQMLPHEYSIEHEKTLRKIATKGGMCILYLWLVTSFELNIIVVCSCCIV